MFCSALYNSLTLMEKEMLNSSSVLLPSPPVGKVDSRDDGGIYVRRPGSPHLSTSSKPVRSGLSTTLTSHPLLNLGQNTTSVTFCNSPVTTRVTALTSSPTFAEVVQGITTTPVERKIIPGYQESKEGDSSLSVILDSLIPYLRDNSDPTPLPTFFGNRVVDPASLKGDLGEVSLPEAEPTKEYAWSHGLEIEYSPVNITLSSDEIWGGSAASGHLSGFFNTLLHAHKLIDVKPDKIVPTWRNVCAGSKAIAKRLDKFLVSEDLLMEARLHRAWVEYPYVSDHAPIFLQLENSITLRDYPFKFHAQWLLEKDFNDMVIKMWKY
jgi:hypothetical protein